MRAETKSKSPWQKTKVANLVRYVPSGIYFARVRVGGKLIWKSLETTVFSVAQVKLPDFVKEQRKLSESFGKRNGKLTFGQALAVYEKELEDNTRLKPAAKLYRRKTIEALVRNWPGLEEREIKSISESECLQWAKGFRDKYSASVFNNTVGTLRHVLGVGIKEGARYSNPANAIQKAEVKQKELKLPEQEDFWKLIKEVEEAGGRFSRHCANLIRFLAFGGFRKSEAAKVTWADCDFDREEIVVRGDELTSTKNWSIRRVQMIPDMKELLLRLKAERCEEPPETSVMVVRECQKAINSACKKLKIPRFTHHDLRHLFATQCIESNVDVPTVSNWLGHKDGGALAMKVYGHLRNQHSAEMAKKVRFGPRPQTQNTEPVNTSGV